MGNIGFFKECSETIAACDLKFGRCIQLMKFIKVYEY